MTDRTPAQRVDEDREDTDALGPAGTPAGTLPGDPSEGATPGQMAGNPRGGSQEEFEAEMRAREAARGEGSVGVLGRDIAIGTPAGAPSDVLREQREVPADEHHLKGQQKDRQPQNQGSDYH